MEPLYYDESSRGRYYLVKERRVASRIRKGGEGKAWLTRGAPRALIRPARSRGEAGYGSILGYDRGGQNGLCGRQTRSPGLPTRLIRCFVVMFGVGVIRCICYFSFLLSNPFKGVNGPGPETSATADRCLPKSNKSYNYFMSIDSPALVSVGSNDVRRRAH